jgi:MYXO-CTERM domain-containing protein
MLAMTPSPAVGPITNAGARIATHWVAIVVLAAWGFGEAILVPIVPDVLLCLLAVAAPRRAAPLFGWTVLGALVGSIVLSSVTLGDPAAGRGIVLGVPGITQAALDSATGAVHDGNPLAMVHIGPGTPIKVSTVAWWAGSGTPAAYLAGVLLNRLVRIGPDVALFALLGLLAPAFVRRRERLLLVAYALFWLLIGMLANRVEGISPPAQSAWMTESSRATNARASSPGSIAIGAPNRTST